jgi:cystathionine beta-lyase
MSLTGLDRRAFLRNAGVTALVGATGSRIPLVAAVGEQFAPDNGKYDFDTIYNRIGTNAQKWDRPIGQYGKGSIDVGMGVADLDFKLAPSITNALEGRLRHQNFGYLDSQRPFIDTVVEWNKNRYGIAIDPNTVVMSEGVHPALIAAIQTFSPPGSKVLLLSPTYSGFYSDINFTRTRAEESPLTLVTGRYSIDFDDFERRISHDTNSFILCNPQNPTGNFWSAEDLMRLGEICLRRRVVVLADEIHRDFVNKGSKYTPFSSLPNKDVVRNSITFKAASKSFGLSAMKCAWFFSDNPEYLARVRSNYRADISTLGLFASHGAHTGGGEWLNQAVAYLDGNHDLVASYARDHLPLVKYTKAQGTFLAWLDVSALADKIGAKVLAAENTDARGWQGDDIG